MNLGDKIDSFEDGHDSDVDSQDLGAQVEKKRLENVRYNADTKDRQWLAKWTAWLISIYLAAVILILVFNNCFYMYISDNVLMTLLGTTTLNVLGIPFIVLRGYFERPKL